MDLPKIDKRMILYGLLSTLDNLLQSTEGKVFPDMTMKQHFFMVSVNVFGTNYPTLSEMGDFIGCSYQNIKKLAEQLQKKGYLQIETDKNDRRKLRLIPTEEFRGAIADKFELTQMYMRIIYNDIPTEELEITIRTISKMIENIKEQKEKINEKEKD